MIQEAAPMWIRAMSSFFLRINDYKWRFINRDLSLGQNSSGDELREGPCSWETGQEIIYTWEEEAVEHTGAGGQGLNPGLRQVRFCSVFCATAFHSYKDLFSEPE